MTPQEAIDTLRAAKLYIRNLDDHGEIVGGGWVDRSGVINVIQDSFMLSPTGPEGETYTVSCFNSLEEHQLPLEEAVALIIKTIQPGRNIEPESKSPEKD